MDFTKAIQEQQAANASMNVEEGVNHDLQDLVQQEQQSDSDNHIESEVRAIDKTGENLTQKVNPPSEVAKKEESSQELPLKQNKRAIIQDRRKAQDPKKGKSRGQGCGCTGNCAIF